MATSDEDDLMIGAGLDSLLSHVATSGQDVTPAGALESDDDALVLELADLLPDDAGEVVLMAGEDVAVNLQSDEPMTESGVSEAHVTASGVDVTGHHFYSFEGGVTIYSPHDLLVVTETESF